MFSKILRLGLILTLVTSCANEDVQHSEPIEAEVNGGSECLTGFTERFSGYVDGKLSNAQVAEFWNCTSGAITAFQKLTVGEGQSGQVYSPQAIRRFLQRYFFKTTSISDSFLISIMEVKRVLLAGSTQALSKNELRRLQNLLMVLKDVSVEMNPHVLVIFGRKSQATDDEIRRAGVSLRRALAHIAAWLEDQQQPYSYEQLHALLLEIRKMASPSSDSIFSNIDKALVFLPTAKTILVQGSADGIGGAEWKPLLKALGQGYSFFLGLKYSLSEDLNAGLVRRSLPEAIGEIELLLRDSVKARKDKVIPNEEWARLFVDLERSDLLPAAFKAESMLEAWNLVLSRLLAGSAFTGGLTLRHLKNLDRPIQLWLSLHDSVSARPVGSKPLSDLDSKKFKAVLDASLPLQWDAEGRMIVGFSTPPTWTREAKRRMIWPYVILNWLKEAYVGVNQDYLSEDDMKLAVSEILPRLKSFGWLTSTKQTIGTRLLREANLFTTSGNGDQKVEMHEGVRYLAFVASSLRASELWLEEGRRWCGGSSSDCVRRLALDPRSKAISSLPLLKAKLANQDFRVFERYMKQAEETALGRVQRGEFSKGDLLQVWMLFQYVETFLFRFDQDRGETIELEEALKAFEVYGAILAKLLPGAGLSQDEVLAFFTFMMNYGDTPFGMFGGTVAFTHWKWHRNDWVFSADRFVLMSILNQLAKL